MFTAIAAAAGFATGQVLNFCWQNLKGPKLVSSIDGAAMKPDLRSIVCILFATARLDTKLKRVPPEPQIGSASLPGMRKRG
jgi:hypothetical protein